MRNALLTDALRATLAQLRLRPEAGIISEKVALLNDFGIPAVAVGVSRGRKSVEEDYVELGPLKDGFRQLLLLVERCADAIGEKEGRAP
jgi:hypothetical protein